MAYTPTEWQTGDIVTAEKLNKLENGVSASVGGAFIVSEASNTLDKTWQEIHDAIASGKFCVVIYMIEAPTQIGVQTRILTGAWMESDEGATAFIVGDISGEYVWIATSANGYPVAD